MSPYINIFGINVYTYAIFIVLGIIAATIVFFMFGRKYAHLYDLVELLVYVCINAVVFAKIVFLVSAIPDIIATPEYLNACLVEGGFNYMGGLVGALITLFIIVRNRHLSLPRVASAFVMATSLGHAILKVGCLYSGCCYGLSYTGPFAIVIEGVGSVFPMAMIESIVSLGVFVFLFIMFQKTEYKEESRVHIYFMLLYPVLKFIMEFFRGDQVRGVFILSVAQWLCILVFVAGAVLYLDNLAHRPKTQVAEVKYISLSKKTDK